MGCGASHGLGETSFVRDPRSVDRDGQSDSSESDSETEIRYDAIKKCPTPVMDKLWKMKNEIFKSDVDITLDGFLRKCNLGMREVYRALDVFGKISDSSKLDTETLSKLLIWPDSNAMLKRFDF